MGAYWVTIHALRSVSQPYGGGEVLQSFFFALQSLFRSRTGYMNLERS